MVCGNCIEFVNRNSIGKGYCNRLLINVYDLDKECSYYKDNGSYGYDRYDDPEEESSSSSGGCLCTALFVEFLGQTDDSEDMRLLRKIRDTMLSKTDVNYYYYSSKWLIRKLYALSNEKRIELSEKYISLVKNVLRDYTGHSDDSSGIELLKLFHNFELEISAT